MRSLRRLDGFCVISTSSLSQHRCLDEVKFLTTMVVFNFILTVRRRRFVDFSSSRRVASRRIGFFNETFILLKLSPLALAIPTNRPAQISYFYLSSVINRKVSSFQWSTLDNSFKAMVCNLRHIILFFSPLVSLLWCIKDMARK